MTTHPGEDITFACQDCGKNITFPRERRGGVETCPYCFNYVDVPYKSETSPIAEPTKQSEGPGAQSRTNSQLWIEVFAVLCLAFFPSLYYSFAIYFNFYHPNNYNFIDDNLYYIIHTFQVCVPLLLILALTKEHWHRFGFVRPVWAVDIFVIVAIWTCTGFVYYYSHQILPSWMFIHKHDYNYGRPDGLFTFLLLLASCIASGFSQELVMRGYLLTRLEQLLSSTLGAVIITSVLFGSYHLYQGLGPAITDVGLGLVYAIAFCIFRRLWPLCAAHALHNLLASLLAR
jgi:membrane protease YdiL (CAAX protease family)